MRARGGRFGRTRGGRLVGAVVASLAMMSLASCGLPSGGSVQKVDDEAVPYRLLESGSPSGGTAPHAPARGRVPVVFWISGQRLLPEATNDSCAETPHVLIERLLGALADGPSDDARAGGRSSAIPPDAGLGLVGVEDGTVTVDIERETSLSAELLPVAVGQVVLTITSAPTVRSVVLVSDGEQVQVPLPGGVLTDGPVTARDYADLLPERLQESGRVGCPQL